MPLVLRVDVDKAYERANFKEKVLSKIREDYWFAAISRIGYLNHLKKFLARVVKHEQKRSIFMKKRTANKLIDYLGW